MPQSPDACEVVPDSTAPVLDAWAPWDIDGPMLRKDCWTAKQLYVLPPLALHLESRKVLIGDHPPGYIAANCCKWISAVHRQMKLLDNRDHCIYDETDAADNQCRINRARQLADVQIIHDLTVNDDTAKRLRLRKQRQRRRNRFRQYLQGPADADSDDEWFDARNAFSNRSSIASRSSPTPSTKSSSTSINQLHKPVPPSMPSIREEPRKRVVRVASQHSVHSYSDSSRVTTPEADTPKLQDSEGTSQLHPIAPNTVSSSSRPSPEPESVAASSVNASMDASSFDPFAPHKPSWRLRRLRLHDQEKHMQKVYQGRFLVQERRSRAVRPIVSELDAPVATSLALRWKECTVLARRTNNPRKPLVLYFYTTVDRKKLDRRSRRRWMRSLEYKVELNSSYEMSVFSPLDFSLAIWKPRSSNKRRVYGAASYAAKTAAKTARTARKHTMVMPRKIQEHHLRQQREHAQRMNQVNHQHITPVGTSTSSTAHTDDSDASTSICSNSSSVTHERTVQPQPMSSKMRRTTFTTDNPATKGGSWRHAWKRIMKDGVFGALSAPGKGAVNAQRRRLLKDQHDWSNSRHTHILIIHSQSLNAILDLAYLVANVTGAGKSMHGDQNFSVKLPTIDANVQIYANRTTDDFMSQIRNAFMGPQSIAYSTLRKPISTASPSLFKLMDKILKSVKLLKDRLMAGNVSNTVLPLQQPHNQKFALAWTVAGLAHRPFYLPAYSSQMYPITRLNWLLHPSTTLVMAQPQPRCFEADMVEPASLEGYCENLSIDGMSLLKNNSASFVLTEDHYLLHMPTGDSQSSILAASYDALEKPIEPYALDDAGEIRWIEKSTCLREVDFHDVVARLEFERRCRQISKAKGTLDLLHVNTIEQNNCMLELHYAHGRIMQITFESADLAMIWQTRLVQIQQYWKTRQHAQMLELSGSTHVDWCITPFLQNRCIVLSGHLFMKRHQHMPFKACHVILTPFKLVIFRTTQERGRVKTDNEVSAVSFHHKRYLTIDLKDTYVYTGQTAAHALVDNDRNIDASNPGVRALPRCYEDGWLSTETELERCFVVRCRKHCTTFLARGSIIRDKWATGIRCAQSQLQTIRQDEDQIAKSPENVFTNID